MAGETKREDLNKKSQKPITTNLIEVTDKNLGDATRLLINSKFKTYEEAKSFLGISSVQVFRNYLSQLSNNKGNLFKLMGWLDKLNYEVIFTLKPIGDKKEGFSTEKFEKYILEKKFTSAHKMLILYGNELDEESRLKVEIKLEAAKGRGTEESTIPINFNSEALEKVIAYNSPSTISGRVNQLILREFIDDNLFKMINSKLDGEDPLEAEAISKLKDWKNTNFMEVKQNCLEYSVEETVILGKRIFVLLHKEDNKMVEVTDLFTTTFLREACLQRNKDSLRVFSLTRHGEYNIKISVFYKDELYEASIIDKDPRPKRITFKK
ncbi:hypothetical protein PM10SUCC1_32890 [Propionigenium maris DSM 9537]|uniref:Uncharacterized protein n=1 Tax=Propionigenium maris DSM 9537 TaxID=1123000 RepID=A0A9W6GP63_9FUSO|nr:hypothetical protein [Propionigenium maris]GLI57775.1 hypothetical protein PM10SUCC1_32890 [Propionigenium maris DSM 9537]